MPRIRWSRFVLLSSLISLALPTAGRETGKAKSHLPLQTSHRLAVMQSSHNALAYLQNGNLYVKEMPGEPARCFLDNKRCYGSPLWSPEGKWVAIHERGTDPNSESINLQIVSRQGKRASLLANCVGGHWSPRGDRFLWQNQKDSSVRIADPGTGHTRVLLSPAKDTIYGLIWSPDAQSIAYVIDGSVVRLNLVTGQKRILISRERNPSYTVSYADLSWSPDGKWLAIVKCFDRPETGGDDNKESESFDEKVEAKSLYRKEVWRIRADNGQEAHREFRSHGYFRSPILQEWTGDSRYLLFWALVYSRAASANRDGVSLYAASVKSDSARLLSGHYRKDSMDGPDMVLSRPDFVASRPGSAKVAVAAGGYRHLNRDKRIALFDASTGRKRYLTKASQSAICPVWSPDQSQIAYLATKTYRMRTGGEQKEATAEADFRLWIMDADGRHFHRLETGLLDTDQAPIWLSDGRRLLFTKGSYGNPKSLWIIDADGRNLHCLVRETDGFALWSPLRNGSNKPPQ